MCIVRQPVKYYTKNDTLVCFTQKTTLQCYFQCNFQCNSMLIYLNAITVMYISSTTGNLYGDIIFYARRSRACRELRRSDSKKAKLEEPSSIKSDQS